ncbi:MAG: protease pro-enzyme activation domain-containing protein [Candidatus Acidiferrales bacterium]
MIPARRFALRSLLLSVGVASLAFFGTVSARAQAPGPQTRITHAIDETNLVTLKGNTHPLARPEFDQGAAPDNEPADRIQLLLKRSPAQEAALRQLLDDQKSSSSPSYHQWLTPAQFGAQFGPSDSDVQTITTWLTSHGFTVNRVSAGRTVIEFSGNAGQIREAFHTQIHKYMVNGQSHWANSSDPQIPAALAPVVAGPVTLHNFGRKAMHVMGPKIAMAKQTSDATKPEFAATCGGAPCYVVGPADFATLYNTQSLWNAGTDGTGQTIAIVGDSNINCADVTNFRTFFDLPVTEANDCSDSSANVQIFVNGADPGLNGDEIEADLDVEWSGAVAKGAHVDFVTSETTDESQGIDLSAEYIVDNDLAPVMSESFGECELALENAGVAYYSELWEQAAAEGITVMVSAGDSGAAGCDDDNTQDVAVNGLSVSGIASTAFNVAVGGTDFNDFTNQTNYWNSSDSSSSTHQSIKTNTYIPEIPWDDSCAALNITGCNGITENSASENIVGGGGGQSLASLKPSWQEGAAVTGLAMTDGSRDLPDVSLFAAAGSGSNSFYPICEADADATCMGSNGEFNGVGGTSSSAPAFAGIMAMVNQYMASQSMPARQGNANYELYVLASKQVTAGTPCSSVSITTSTGGCTFYDITTGSNSVPCIEGTGCTVQTENANAPGLLEEVNSVGHTDGILAWQAGAGFDLSTGLGSVNAFNLVHDWPAIVGAFTPSTTTLKLCTGGAAVCVSGGSGTTLTLVHGTTVTATVTAAPASGTGTPTGDAALIGTPNTLADNSGSSNAGVDIFNDSGNSDVYTLTNGTITGATSFLIGGQYAVTAHYGGDGKFGASNSTAVNVNITPEASTTTVSAAAADPSLLAEGASIDEALVSTPVYGDVDFVRVDVVGQSTEESATGTVNVTNNGVAFGCPGTCNLNTEGNLEIEAGVNVVPTLPTGPHSFAATYSGDPSYAASSSTAAVALNVAIAPTSTLLSASPTAVTAGHTTVLTATVTTDSIGVAPTGNVTFFAGGAAITAGAISYTRTPGSLIGNPGTGVGSQAASVIATLTYLPTASTTITATYTADVNYATSTSAGVALTASSTFSVTSPNSTSGTAVVIASPGMSGASTLGVTLAAGTASVMLTATLTSAPTGAIDSPTCSFAPNPDVAAGTSNVMMTCGTMAAMIPPSPITRPTLRIKPLTWIVAAASTLLALLFLLALPERRRGYALLVLVLVFAVGAGVACGGGGGSGSGGGGGGGGGALGTTVGLYEYTVSGTPAGGTVTVWLNVE